MYLFCSNESIHSGSITNRAKHLPSQRHMTWQVECFFFKVRLYNNVAYTKERLQKIFTTCHDLLLLHSFWQHYHSHYLPPAWFTHKSIFVFLYIGAIKCHLVILGMCSWVLMPPECVKGRHYFNVHLIHYRIYCVFALFKNNLITLFWCWC